MKEMDVYEALEKRAKAMNCTVLVDDAGFVFVSKKQSGEIRIVKKLGWAWKEIQSQILPGRKQIFFIKGGNQHVV